MGFRVEWRKGSLRKLALQSVLELVELRLRSRVFCQACTCIVRYPAYELLNGWAGNVSFRRHGVLGEITYGALKKKKNYLRMYSYLLLCAEKSEKARISLSLSQLHT